MPFGSGVIGEVTLITATNFATSMEAATPDASLVTAALPALQAAAAAIEPTLTLQPVAEHAGEIATETLLTGVDGEFVVIPVLENDEYVASLVVRVVDDEMFEPVAPVARPIDPPVAATHRAAHHLPQPAALEAPYDATGAEAPAGVSRATSSSCSVTAPDCPGRRARSHCSTTCRWSSPPSSGDGA